MIQTLTDKREIAFKCDENCTFYGGVVMERSKEIDRSKKPHEVLTDYLRIYLQEFDTNGAVNRTMQINIPFADVPKIIESLTDLTAEPPATNS